MTNKRKWVLSGSPFEQKIGFSRAVRIDKMIFVAGTAPITEEGNTHALGDCYEQTLKCFEISKEAIEDLGGKISDVVKTKIYLKNIEDWEKAARAHQECFKDVKPACTFLQVNGFINSDWLVETEMDCYVSNE